MISRQLAEFAHAFSLDDVPREIVTRAKYLILDAIGIAYASSGQDFAARALASVQAFGSGEHALIGFGDTASLRDAMLLNGVTVHGLDFDDTHTNGVIHATASSLPCALAMTEKHDVSARTLLETYVLAMEVSTRLGSVAKGGFHQTGFHPTGLIGIFGCTLAASRLLGSSVEQMQMAQGIALSMASGSLEFLEDGAWTKRLHPGWAAGAAATAAVLANNDFIGPKAAYEGRYGLYASYLNTRNAQADATLATSGLGDIWEIEGVAVKPLPACHFTHAAADAAAHIKRESGVRIGDIETVRVKVPEGVVGTVCEPVANKKQPKNSYDAQFSIPYIVATALKTGDFQLRDLEADALGDAERRALAQRVEYEIDDEADFPRFYSGEVVVELADGTVLRHREAVNRGNKERPLSNDEIVAKYEKNMVAADAQDRTQSILDAVKRLDEAGFASRDFAAALRAAETVTA